MIIKRINIEWSSMTGMGPAAWDGDRHILNMHTPHHEKDHQTEPADEGEKAAIHNGDVKQRKEAEE